MISATRTARIQSTADAQWLAERRLPGPLAQFVRGGSGRGATLAANVSAFDELAFRPRFATSLPEVDLATTVLGHPVSMPVLVAPMGGARLVHRDGDAGLACAAGSAGTICCVSSFTADPIEALTRVATGPVFFQLYYPGDLRRAEAVIDRVREAGAAALILTIDTPLVVAAERPIHRRVSAPVPRIRELPRLAPQVLRRPGWMVDFLRDGRRGMYSPMMSRDGALEPMWVVSKALMRRTPIWSDVAWARERFGGPVIVKGVVSAEDARRALDAGADAIVVSNHGGNALDDSPATIKILPEVVAAVDGRVEVLFDSGVRRAADVCKALALGARSVLLGRSLMWALGAAGRPGAAHMLELYRRGLTDHLRYLGCPSVAELDASYVRVA